MNLPKHITNRLTPTNVAEISFWWFIECDEFDFFIINDGIIEQILWIADDKDKSIFTITTWNGSLIKIWRATPVTRVWKVEEFG